MAIYYVHQKQSYKVQKNGGYIWSPTKTKAGTNNAGFTMMTKIRKGDFILHQDDKQCIKAISVAECDYQPMKQPEELKAVGDWVDDGYLVKATYHELTPPLNVVQFADWLSNYLKNNNVPSPFAKNGMGKQQYMCALDSAQAIFLLKEAIKTQTDQQTLQYLCDALAEIIDDDKETLDELVNNGNHPVFLEFKTWSYKPQPRIMKVSKGGRPVLKRNPYNAASALYKATYQCEYNDKDPTFLRQNGTPYTEAHHLIPVSGYRDFEDSVDVMENIVSLCCHCHKLLHYGRFEDKKPILEKLYNARIDALRACGLALTLQDLEEYYK